jgi:N-acetylneuraminate synthase
MDRMVGVINIAGHKIGPGHACFIIAEAGVNHNGSLDMARELIDAAVDARADAVKFQSFKADQMVTAEAPKAEYQVQTTGSSESQLDMLRRLELSAEDHRLLMNYCLERNILFMSSPFDHESANLLDALNVEVFKIPSGEITNFPLLTHVARKGKPMVVSTGMSYLSEVEAAVQTIENAGNREFVLLHCVSNYPAEPKDINLNAMGTMGTAFGVPVGYSDHTVGIEIPIAAVALGATVIEKHLTLDCTLPGPDHRASLEPEEFAAMVRGIRSVEAALGHGRKEPSPSESDTAAVARKSLVAAVDIPAGTILTEQHIAVMRPGTGMPPSELPSVIGATLEVTLPAGALLTWDMLSGNEQE